MTMQQESAREIIERVFADQDMIRACRRRDFGAIIDAFRKYGITQHQIAGLTGIAQPRLSDYKAGRYRPTLDTFQKLADGLEMPAHARRALGLAVGAEDGGQVGGEGLDFLTDTFDLLLLAEMVGRKGDSVKRREMLSMASKIGAAAAIAQSESWERVTYALTKPTGMDESTVRAMEARSDGFHRLEEWVPAAALYKGIAAHLRDVGTLLNSTASDPNDELRSRLIIAAGETSVMAGWLASDKGDTTAARNFYDTAERAAREVNDPGIIACTLAYRSYIPSTKGAHGRSRALLTAALENISVSDSPGTVAWLRARHAEESAALGDKQQALRSWGEAEEAFSLADPEEDRVWTKFMDQNRFDSYHIATYANIDKLEEAHELAMAVLARLPRPDRKKAIIILEDIAAAHIRQGSVAEAARLARNGLILLRETEFTMWLPRYESLAQSLRRWGKHPNVRGFLEEFATTKQYFASPLT